MTVDAQVREAMWYARTGVPMPTGKGSTEGSPDGSTAASRTGPWPDVAAPKPADIDDTHVELYTEAGGLADSLDVNAVTCQAEATQMD